MKTKLSNFIKNNNSNPVDSFKDPCLKWAGGKRKMLSSIYEHNTSGTLFDVFCGSAVISLNCKNKNIVINDFNKDLIDLYEFIKNKPKKLISVIDELFKNHTPETYYILRSEFNTIPTSIRKSAIFVYMNKFGYNGLCRYNKSGEYNSPVGRTSSGKLPTSPSKIILEMSKIFNKKNITFTNLDFADVLAMVKKGDFVVLDPPYTPINKTGFVNYSGSGFTEDQHNKLVVEAIRLMNLGVVVIIFDHDLPITRERHKNATNIVELSVARPISRESKTRKNVAEIMAVYERK